MTKLSLVFLIGCGTHVADTGPDAAVGPDAPPAWSEAMPAAMPQLVKLNGTTLATPKVRAIFFAGDAAVQAQIADFEAQLATSAYWTATTSEYGVGPLVVQPTLVAPGAAPTTDTALETLLKTQLDGTHAGWTYDPSTIYSVFLPAGVVLTGAGGSKSCQDYGAYHNELAGAHGESIVYALMPRCQGQGPAIDDLTASASHEWAEAATDPRVNTAPAFGDADAANYVWAYTPAAENGDYCEYLDSAYQRLVGNFLVQRTWSNAAAKAGHDPCVPALAGPYVAAAPILIDDAPIGDTTGTVTTKAAKVPLGMSKTIEVQLFSDQPTADFTVSAIDVAADFQGAPAELAFQWDKQSGHNGDKLHLTITRKVAGQFMGSEFAIVTTVDGKPTNLWWSFAAN